MESIFKAVAIILATGACSGSTALTEPVDGPDSFVLVHSAWLGGWAWEPVASILEEQGHDDVSPDLPGHGANALPPSQVTMDGYVRGITDILDTRQEPVILVGHSLGGIVVARRLSCVPIRSRRWYTSAASSCLTAHRSWRPSTGSRARWYWTTWSWPRTATP